jgi:hypothetical protein
LRPDSTPRSRSGWRTGQFSALHSEEEGIRRSADGVVEYAMLVDGSDRGRLSDVDAPDLLALLGGAATVDRYRLVYTLQRH